MVKQATAGMQRNSLTLEMFENWTDLSVAWRQEWLDDLCETPVVWCQTHHISALTVPFKCLGKDSGSSVTLEVKVKASKNFTALPRISEFISSF